MNYSSQQLESLYSLARMYFELGYLIPAERIFSGLAAVNPQFAPALLGLGLLRLERGQSEEAAAAFRQIPSDSDYSFAARIGMGLAFLADEEDSRARSILSELEKTLEPGSLDAVEQRFLESLRQRCAE